jgi:hypothetical protein
MINEFDGIVICNPDKSLPEDVVPNLIDCIVAGKAFAVMGV